jgi:hypothetical protein
VTQDLGAGGEPGPEPADGGLPNPWTDSVGADLRAETLVLYWFWPERTRFATLLADEAVWSNYRLAADGAGMVLDIVSVDDVDVLAAPWGSRVFVRGEPVDPTRALFHTKLYTWPMFGPDVWRSLATFQTLAAAGCHALIRPDLNLLSNDKAATLLHLRDVDHDWLPTVRLPTRELTCVRVRLQENGIDFPVVVKPASWGSGKGVTVARDEQELATVLRLAAAAELTMVVQPLLGGGAREPADVRVYCVDGRPVGALRRTPGPGGGVANVTAGGTGELIEVPPDLAARAAAVAAALDTPWLGVDFLCVDGAAYLSEVEIDACIGPVTSRLPGMDYILALRFAAYRGRFERWLGAAS